MTFLSALSGKIRLQESLIVLAAVHRVSFGGKVPEGHDASSERFICSAYKSGGPHVTLQEGEICLDETVPFGVTFQKGRALDAEGNLVSSFEQKVLESGAGKSGTAALVCYETETSVCLAIPI